MPQDRRTAFPDDPTHRPSADCAASAPNPTAAADILRTCGRPAVRSAGSHQDAAGRSSPPSPPRSGIHTAASSCRGSACRIKAPYSVPYHRRRGVFLFAEVCQSGDPPARRQPTPQLSTTTTTTSSTTTSQPSPPSAAAADLQGNQARAMVSGHIGYNRTHSPGYHHHPQHHHSGGPTHPPTHPLPPRPGETAARFSVLNFCRKIAPGFRVERRDRHHFPPYPLAFRRIRWPGIPQLASAGIWRRAERQAPRR